LTSLTDPTLLQRKLALRAVRTIVSLKHTTARDTELDRVLAEVGEAFDTAVALGQSFELDVAGLLEDPAVVRNAAQVYVTAKGRAVSTRSRSKPRRKTAKR
jgi:hypothetical protein